MLRLCLVLYISLCSLLLKAQTLGGSSGYTFIQLSSSPALSAAGGINTSYLINDVGFAINNPSLLNSNMHEQLQASFNAFLGGVQAYSLVSACYMDKWKTTLGAHVFFINYGDITQTDASGNIYGNFKPVDYAVQVSASKQYLEKWKYGLSVKFLHSAYGQYTSSAIAFDAGVLYIDSARHISLSVVAKNMGISIKSFAGDKEDLPFDLQAGLTQKLAKAPLSFSITAQHIHQFKLGYNDTIFNRENNFAGNSSFLNSLFNHFVVAAHFLASPNLSATIGYNFLRRSELNLGNSDNGLNGFSAGFSANFKKMGFQYARAYYQNNIAYNQFGLLLKLNEFGGTWK